MTQKLAPRIWSSIHTGNVLYRKGQRTRANIYFQRAAEMFTPAVLLKGLDSGFMFRSVLSLGYYFAVTGDRPHARKMWRRYEYVVSVYDSKAGYSPLTNWRSARAAAAALAASDPQKAFAAMLAGDLEKIENENPWRTQLGEPAIIEAGLHAGKMGHYANALRLFLRAATCGWDPAEGYPYYAIGVTYWALHHHHRAFDAWLASTMRTDDPPTVDIPTQPRAAFPSTVMLLQLF